MTVLALPWGSCGVSCACPDVLGYRIPVFPTLGLEGVIRRRETCELTQSIHWTLLPLEIYFTCCPLVVQEEKRRQSQWDAASRPITCRYSCTAASSTIVLPMECFGICLRSVWLWFNNTTIFSWVSCSPLLIWKGNLLHSSQHHWSCHPIPVPS